MATTTEQRNREIAGKKAAATRKRNAAKRSQAARRAAATRADAERTYVEGSRHPGRARRPDPGRCRSRRA